MRQTAAKDAVAAWLGFFVWEAVKIVVCVAMLLAAPRLIADLDWLALLLGLIVTLKGYWLVLLKRSKM